MKIDIYGQQVYSEEDLCELYLCNSNLNLKKVLSELIINFPASLELDNLPKIIQYSNENLQITQFDEKNQSIWFMPDDYKNLDIAKHILDLCKTQEELQRAGTELLIYQERHMFDFLKYMKYLVDILRNNNIVWGVGRGSSVASFVLFLLGVHKINSLYFDLSIDEFLK